MTCVYKEYEVKIKMVQEQWLKLKIKFVIGLQHENRYLVGGELTFDKGEYKFGGGSLLGGGFFQTEGINKYLAGEK